MKKTVSCIFVSALALGVILPISAAAQDGGAGRGNRASAVFVMSNSAEKNEAIAFSRTAEGTLEESGRFATGGRGSGGNTDPLESQGSLTLSQDHQLLFAVNAGSGEVSVFRVQGTVLALVDRVSSGGTRTIQALGCPRFWNGSGTVDELLLGGSPYFGHPYFGRTLLRTPYFGRLTAKLRRGRLADKIGASLRFRGQLCIP